jgi:cytokinin riboside 5'-monophosphate phosphoribohydrolase
MAGSSASVRQLKSICVLCGSLPGHLEMFKNAAKDLGKVLAKRKIHLVYGGGNLGLMGIVSQAAAEGGSQVLGIVPKALDVDNIIGETKGEKLVVSGMHARITEMINHADAFIALPGGLGTLEEIFTIASWAQLNIHQKPIGILDVNFFYGVLMLFLDDAVRTGLLAPSSRRIIVQAKTADELIDKLQAFKPELNSVVSQLDWTDNDDSGGKKRKLHLNLNL